MCRARIIIYIAIVAGLFTGMEEAVAAGGQGTVCQAGIGIHGIAVATLLGLDLNKAIATAGALTCTQTGICLVSIAVIARLVLGEPIAAAASSRIGTAIFIEALPSSQTSSPR